jgi:hypothetical protein
VERPSPAHVLCQANVITYTVNNLLGEVVPWYDARPRNTNFPLYEDFRILIRTKPPACPIRLSWFAVEVRTLCLDVPRLTKTL